MQRCMSNSTSVSEYQRLAVCSTQYRDKYEEVNLESYNDYPQSAVNNAKSAVKWAEKNGWGSKQRQIAKTSSLLYSIQRQNKTNR
jgi:predicted transcriptional regulator